MTTKSVIKQLINAISEKTNKEMINAFISIITENISEYVKEPLFFSLPLDTIFTIINKTNFIETNEQSELIKSILEGVNASYPNEALSILNQFSYDMLPPMTLDQIIGIVSQFNNSGLLVKLGELQE